LKQQLVSMEKAKSIGCGFGYCPKKYKYMGNPVLLDKIFSNQNPRTEKIVEVKRPRHLDPKDSMHTTNCVGCGEEYLLRVDNPICTTCRRVI